MTNREIRSELVKIAAEMVRCVGMPSEFLEDWNLPKTTPKGARKQIYLSARQAKQQAVHWGVKLSKISDLLK